MSKVIRISDFTSNCRTSSPEQAIEDFRKYLEEDPLYSKVLLIALKTEESRFEIIWNKAQMMNSEGVTVLELVKDDLIEYLKR